MSDTNTRRQHTGKVDALNLAFSLCLCYSLYIALMRSWIRRGTFGVHDLIALAAILVTQGHTGSSYAALMFGSEKLWIEVSSSGKLTELIP